MEIKETQTKLKLVNQTNKPRREVDSRNREGLKLSHVSDSSDVFRTQSSPLGSAFLYND